MDIRVDTAAGTARERTVGQMMQYRVEASRRCVDLDSGRGDSGQQGIFTAGGKVRQEEERAHVKEEEERKSRASAWRQRRRSRASAA